MVHSLQQLFCDGSLYQLFVEREPNNCPVVIILGPVHALKTYILFSVFASVHINTNGNEGFRKRFLEWRVLKTEVMHLVWARENDYVNCGYKTIYTADIWHSLV